MLRVWTRYEGGEGGVFVFVRGTFCSRRHRAVGDKADKYNLSKSIAT